MIIMEIVIMVMMMTMIVMVTEFKLFGIKNSVYHFLIFLFLIFPIQSAALY